MTAKENAENLLGFLGAIEFSDSISVEQSKLVKVKLSVLIDILDIQLDAENASNEDEQDELDDDELDDLDDLDEDDLDDDDDDDDDDDENFGFYQVDDIYVTNETVDAIRVWLNGFYEAINSVKLFTFKRNHISLLKVKISELILNLSHLKKVEFLDEEYDSDDYDPCSDD